MAFPAIDILGVVPTALFAAAGRVDGLTIDAGGGARRIGLLLGADGFAKPIVEDVERTVVPPLVEVPPDRALGGKVFGQVSPLAPGPQNVENRIDDIPQIRGAGSPAGVDGNVRFDQRPLRVGDITRVRLCSHKPLYVPPTDLWDSHSVLTSLTCVVPDHETLNYSHTFERSRVL